MTTKRSLLFSCLSSLTIAIVIFSYPFHIQNVFKLVIGQTKDSLSNFTELTLSNDYNSEQHMVETEDGYVLTVFRMPGGKHCRLNETLPPVLIMHGLLQSSESWLYPGPENGLPYLVSDSCYDVWIGNVRGNLNGRKHVNLNADKDAEFWNFTFDEMAYHDLPAMIDYVTRHTGVNKITYIGYSQGAGIFVAMCSERPEYCDKVNSFFGIGPSTRHKNTRSKVCRYISQFVNKFQYVIEGIGVQEIYLKGSFLQEALLFICQYTNDLCLWILSTVDGKEVVHRKGLSDTTMENLIRHSLMGTSLRNIARFGQAMTSDKFLKFDYGERKNFVVYGSVEPAEYNISAVKLPTVVIYGNNDGIVDKEDVEWFVGQLPNVKSFLLNDDTSSWTHSGLTYSKIVGDKVYSIISKYLDMYNNHTY